MSVILPNKILSGIPGVSESENSVARFIDVNTVTGSNNVYINDNGELSIGKAVQEDDIMLSVTQRAANIPGFKITGAEDRSEPLLKLAEGGGTPTGDLIQVNTDKLVLTKDGYLGINKAIPTQFFHLGGSAGDFYFESTGTRFVFTYAGVSSIRASNATGQIRFETGGYYERLRITSIGYLGINEPNPETLIEATHSDPFFTFHCATETDDDGERASGFYFKGEDSLGVESTLASIVAGHYGNNTDGKGRLKISCNAGSDGDSPTEIIEITSSLISITTDMIFSGSGSGFPYGCIAGDDETVTCTDQNTYYQVTFDTVGCENLVTGSTANNDITIQKTGIYRMTSNISFHSAVAHDFEFQLKKNNGASDVPHAHSFETTSVANQVESTSITGICTLTAGDTLEIWVQCTDAAGQDCVFDHVSLCLNMIGG